MSQKLHVGIIPDGTRRWSKLVDTDLNHAYEIMMNKLQNIIDLLYQLKASDVSVYLLSKQNLNRKKDDLLPVINAECKFLVENLELLRRRWEINVFIVGDETLLPNEFREIVKKVKAYPKNVNSRNLYLLIGYDPFDEINRLNKLPVQLENLEVPENIDLIIRTGDDKRISNFLPLQSAYAELFFLADYFNDVSDRQVKNVISTFMSIERRFGS